MNFLSSDSSSISVDWSESRSLSSKTHSKSVGVLEVRGVLSILGETV